MAKILRNLNVSTGGKRIGGIPWVGVLASEVPTGFAYPSLLANDLDAGFPNRLYSVQILTWPAGVLLKIGERGEVALTALDGVSAPANGVHSGTQRVRKYEPGTGLVYNDTGAYSITIGTVAPADPTVTGVTISPTSATVSGGGTLTFSHHVDGLNGASQAVTYELVSGSIAGDDYTAPPARASTQVLQVIVRSVQDPDRFATATITVPAIGVATVTDSDYQAWLASDDAIPNVLIETWALADDGTLVPFTWSTCGYTTEGTASPTHYAPVIATGIPFTEALSISPGASVGAAVLDIDNVDGVNEDLTSYIWVGQHVYQYFGDLRWNRADYRRVITSVSAGLVRKDDRTLALRMRDMTQRLDVPLSEHKLGGSSANQDETIPLVFGEVENVSGLLSDDGTLERAFHDGPMKAFGDVRAAGLPIDVTEHLDTGRCVPTENNGSTVITASIQGDNYGGVFRKTIATVIQRLLTGYGNPYDRCTDADIDLANFAAFDALHQQTIGHSVASGEKLNVACDFIARSVGAQLVPTADGLLQLIQIALPAAGTPMEIRAEHLAGPLKPAQPIDPIAAVKIAFCRNWTVQQMVAGGVPAVLADSFATEWLTATAVDIDRQRDLKLEGNPEQRNTALMRRVDAEAEAERELALWGPGREVFEFDGLAPLLMLKIGQPVIVYDALNSMQDGTPGQVIEITRDYDNRSVKGKILV